jgi:hypothetical protein
MIGGIVLFAFGLRTALHNTASPLKLVPAFGLLCGVAVYLLATSRSDCASAADSDAHDQSPPSCWSHCSQLRHTCPRQERLVSSPRSASLSSPTKSCATGNAAPPFEHDADP